MSRETFKQRVIAEAAREMELWGDRPIVLRMDVGSALAMCGALQLALRHPQFKTRPSAGNVKGIVAAIAAQVPPEFPGIKRLIELGHEQEFDT